MPRATSEHPVEPAAAADTGNATAPVEFSGLSNEELAQGRVMLKLIDNWQAWVKRRVEQVRFITDNAVRRRVSVDFRQHHDIFGEAPVEWGGRPIHYVPLTLLDKTALLDLDVRDEEGRALPLMTRRKNAAIGTGALIAFAQRIVFDSLSEVRDHLDGALLAGGRFSMRLPRDLEERFWRICYGSAHPLQGGEIDATAEWEAFADVESSKITPIQQWGWKLDSENLLISTVDPQQWRLRLMASEPFKLIAYDLTRLFAIHVPIEYERERRRVIKFSYEQHVREPQDELIGGVKLALRDPIRLRLRRLEDYLEGLGSSLEKSDEEWRTPVVASSRELKPLKLRTRLSRAIGWAAKRATFEMPAIGRGGSFHFEFATPEGTQVRRARLRAVSKKGTTYLARRAAQNVGRIHLYLDGLRKDATGSASVAIKAQSSSVIRSATIAAALTIAGLYIAKDRSLAEETESAVALFLLAPATLAIYTARTGEHPMTTSLLFGLRILTLLTASLGVGGAVLLVADAGGRWVLLVVAWINFTLLAVAWRLAARGWPVVNGSSLELPSRDRGAIDA